MTETEARLQQLRAELQNITDLESAAELLEWDQATYMPGAGAEARGRQTALLGKLVHERWTCPELRSLLESLRDLEQRGTPQQAALVRLARREHERASRIPSELVSELKSHLAASYVAWTEARPNDDFGSVRPMLERTVELSRRVADCFPERDHIADPLIDHQDPGMTAATVGRLFAELREQLVPLVRAITAQAAPDESFLRQSYPKQAQLAFGREVVAELGYDFTRGRQDETSHPFMIRLSGGDVRITTRVREDDLREALFSTIHEAGHAMYEQNIAPEYDGLPLGRGVSAGVHESQSRLWENIVARSRPFWTYFYPKLRNAFPAQLREVARDDFYRAINRVEPSLVRTDADEVTYNLHVMMRFDLEVALLSGELKVDDLPDAWRQRMREDLGIEPPDDRDGCLQDVHWFAGTVGGAFQGYTLGNLMSAQFHEAVLRDRPELPERLAQGDFAALRDWLTEHVYQHGSVYDPPALVERATGRPLGVDALVRYLRSKYGTLYSLPD